MVKSDRVLTGAMRPKSETATKRVLKGPSAAASPRSKVARVLTGVPSVSTAVQRNGGHRILQGAQPSKQAKPARRRTIPRMEEFKKDMGKLAQKKKMTFLETRSVSAEVESQYRSYFGKFESFCKEQGHRRITASNGDKLLADYMDVMFLNGKGLNEGEKTLAAVEFFQVSLKGFLVRSKRALRGWRKERPPQSRLPLPKLVTYGMAMIMLARNRREMALKVILDFDTYLRPGESFDLLKKDVVAPVRGAGRHFQSVAVVVRDIEHQKPDKVGVFDNTILLDSPDRKWLGDILLNHVKKISNKDHKVFDFSSEEFRKEFVQAGERLSLRGLHPYQLRHGGASDDLNSKLREYAAVKCRGRWCTDHSVRRYGKVGKIQKLLNQLSCGDLEFCRWSVNNLEKVFRGSLAAKMP